MHFSTYDDYSDYLFSRKAENENISKACDLLAGAAVVIAGLAAEGRTEITDIHHIQRGYEDMVEKLQGLGADIREEEVPEETESGRSLA